jgi:short-subunit dehydrogenase
MKKHPESRLTALITGASSGLGESIAKNLAGRGAGLVLVSENLSELKRVKNDIEARHPGVVTILETDLFEQYAADRIYDFCDKERLKVDILVNCAGMFVTIEREMRSIGCIENVVNLHVLSLTKLCFLFGRPMIERKLGYILNISSIAAEFPDPASLTYGPTKRYILSFSEALHCEWKRHNVKVTCLTPGGIRTNFFSANNVFIPSIIRRTLLSSDACAEIGLNAMFRGTSRVTPGITGKLQSFFLRMISRPSTYPIIKKIYFSMKKRSGVWGAGE